MPLPEMPLPTTNAPEPLQPRHNPADSHAEVPKLEGVTAKPGPPIPIPPGNGTASSPPASTATAPAMGAHPAWSSALAAAPLTEAGASPVQSALANAQAEQPGGSVQVPDRVGSAAASASVSQPDPAAAAPTQQVAAAVVSLAGAPGGGQRMTLRLEPAELGQVQIRIDRPTNAPAQVDITVQRPETLTLLLRDQPQLQRALDQAGVPADGRGVTLHIAAPDSAASSGNSTSSGVAAGADPGQGGGSGAGTRSGEHRRSGDAGDHDPDDTSIPLPRWLRAGLDITA